MSQTYNIQACCVCAVAGPRWDLSCVFFLLPCHLDDISLFCFSCLSHCCKSSEVIASNLSLLQTATNVLYTHTQTLYILYGLNRTESLNKLRVCENWVKRKLTPKLIHKSRLNEETKVIRVHQSYLKSFELNFNSPQYNSEFHLKHPGPHLYNLHMHRFDLGIGIK